MKKVAAIVVTYNRKKLLEECVTALLNLNCPELDVFIIDNNSSDGTKEYIEKYLSPNVFYYNTKANLGGAGGFAYGCNIVYRQDYDYCWIMDDDTIVKDGSLQSLLKKAEVLNDNFSFLASLVEFTDGEIAIPNAQVINRNALKNINAVKNNLFLINNSTFVSCFVNCKCGKEVGLPIKEMFIYGDDTNYTLRLSKLKPGYLDTDSIVTHKMSSNMSNSLIGCEKERISRWKYGFRNSVYNSKIRKKFLYTFFFYNPAYAIKALFTAKDHKIKRFLTAIVGSFMGLFFNPKIIKDYNDDIVWVKKK